jgi:hypothetical protein
MNPGVADEAGQTARSVVSSLKESPMTLALVVFNVIFIGSVFWLARENRANLDHVISTLLTQQDKAMTMLYNCLPQPDKH